MNAQQPDIASLAMLIGEPARATILLALLSGEALPASDLARRCRLTPQTVSSHLAKLTDAHILAVEPQGRHRYYRLLRPEIAQAIEALQLVAPRPPVRSLNQSEEMKALCFARMCYDHLAGTVGVTLTQAMEERGWLATEDRAFLLTAKGQAAFSDLGIDWQAAQAKRRKFAYRCIDWSERRPHLGGALGAAFAAHCVARGWVQRAAKSRAVTLTTSGKAALNQLFQLHLD